MVVLLLSVHPLLDQCLLHLLLLTGLTFLTTCPRPQLVISLIKEAVSGVPLCWFPWGLMSQPDIIPPVTGNFPFHLLSPLPPEDCHHVLPAILRTQQGVAPGPCVRCVNSLSIKPLMSLLLIQASSSDLKLGKYLGRSCMSAGCSSTPSHQCSLGIFLSN